MHASNLIGPLYNLRTFKRILRACAYPVGIPSFVSQAGRGRAKFSLRTRTYFVRVADSGPPLTFNYSPTVVIVLHILNSKQSGEGMKTAWLVSFLVSLSFSLHLEGES